MSDPAEQLARIYQAGFDITQLELYPGAAAVDLHASVTAPVTLALGQRQLVPAGSRIARPEG